MRKAPEKGRDVNFFELSDGCVWVQEGNYNTHNYLVKNGKPLNQKEVIQYLKDRANVSISDKLLLRSIGKSYTYYLDDGIKITDKLMERLRSQEDLKECLASGKVDYGSNEYNFRLGKIYDAKELSKEDEIDDEYEGRIDITFGQAKKIAEDRKDKYTQFLKGLEMIKQ